eukprot:6208158-Pleurochrysis_carterae.AAC.1
MSRGRMRRANTLATKTPSQRWRRALWFNSAVVESWRRVRVGADSGIPTQAPRKRHMRARTHALTHTHTS